MCVCVVGLYSVDQGVRGWLMGWVVLMLKREVQGVRIGTGTGME